MVKFAIVCAKSKAGFAVGAFVAVVRLLVAGFAARSAFDVLSVFVADCRPEKKPDGLASTVFRVAAWAPLAATDFVASVAIGATSRD